MNCGREASQLRKLAPPLLPQPARPAQPFAVRAEGVGEGELFQSETRHTYGGLGQSPQHMHECRQHMPKCGCSSRASLGPGLAQAAGVRTDLAWCGVYRRIFPPGVGRGLREGRWGDGAREEN